MTNLLNQYPDFQTVAPETERFVASISEESAVVEVNTARTIKGEMDIGPVIENEPTSCAFHQIPQSRLLHHRVRLLIFLPETPFT
ncbi:MAG TPA: hypothetical protein PKJ28_08700 [Bacteroidales bacterium]|nr:hypothetical protein [Bacteroidales bacterium]HPS74535.1 hypothetical protein [Bacteroidales bacterium]